MIWCMVYSIPGGVYSGAKWKCKDASIYHMWELPLIVAKGRWRVLLIANLGSSSQMTKVIREWAHNCAKNLNYCMSWVSISEGSLFWDVSCCREIKGVNCYVSHYLKNFLAFLKGRGGEISLPILLSPSAHMNVVFCPQKKNPAVRQDFLRIRLLDDHWRFPHQRHSCLALCVQRALCTL